MIAQKEALSLDMPVLALEFLELHPDAVLYYLPVKSEVDVDNTIVDFRLAYTNERAVALFELQNGQMLSGQDVKNASKDTFTAQWFHQMVSVLQTEKAGSQTYYNRQPNKHFELTCTKVKEGVLVIARDITTASAEPHEAELNKQMINTLQNGLVVLQAIRNESGKIKDFNMVKVNPAFTRMVNWKEAYLGKSYSLFLQESSEIFQLKCAVIETGEAVTYKYHYQADGMEKWFGICLTKLNGDDLLVTVNDITDKRKAEEERIQQYDQRMQVVFDTSRAGMYTLIPVRNENEELIDFRFGLVNQAVASYLGLHADDMVGALGSLYFPAYKTNGLFDRYVEVMKTGEPAMFDLHYADGYDNFFTIHVVKMGDELFGTFTDHSNLKRLQRDLENSIAELKRSNASLEQFAHAASHDLQEPLRKITRYTTLLEEGHGDELTDKAYGHIERIKTASKRMQRLITDLLVFAEVGTNRVEFEDVDLNIVIQEVLNDLEVAITEKEAVIEVGEMGPIKGESLHLQQLFQNLISNSIKYSRRDIAPRIKITATELPGHETGFCLSEYEMTKAYWHIQLQDNGQGFDDEGAQQIFKIFQRLPQHRTEYSGTGIGLAIVQRVVENHKGYIKAEGVPGEGATFTILLPISQ